MITAKYTEEQDARRHEILGISLDAPAWGGTIKFSTTPAQARALIDEGFLDPEDCQNDSPEAGELVAFAEQYPDRCLLTGYLVVNTRDDRRVSIDTVKMDWSDCPDREKLNLIEEFTKEFRYSDEFSADRNGGYAWWD